MTAHGHPEKQYIALVRERSAVVTMPWEVVPIRSIAHLCEYTAGDATNGGTVEIVVTEIVYRTPADVQL